jgi:hypothetical protein
MQITVRDVIVLAVDPGELCQILGGLRLLVKEMAQRQATGSQSQSVADALRSAKQLEDQVGEALYGK